MWGFWRALDTTRTRTGAPRPGILVTGRSLGSGRTGGQKVLEADVTFSLAAQQQNNSRFLVWGVEEGREGREPAVDRAG